MEKIKNYNDFSYIIGLMQTDGNLHEQSRNRGRLSLEIHKKDFNIIKKISNILTVNYYISERHRITNFGEADFVKLSIYSIAFRNLVQDWGVPSGKKSKIIKPPIHKKKLSYKDYIRGLYDGDGSVGFTKDGKPFVSFTTQSDSIKNFLITFISEITMKNKKEVNRNKRDNIYNIMISNEDAVLFCKEVYTSNCLSIDRKYKIAQKIKQWKRPSTMKKIENRKKWSKDEDKFVLSNTIIKSMEKLNRSKKSIEMRKWRLLNLKYS